MTSEELSTTFSQKSAIGFVLGFVFFFILIALPTQQSFIDSVRTFIGTILNDKEIFQIAASMQKVLALLSLMIIWWVTEAIPIPAVALLPAIMLPLLQVVGWSDGHLFEFTFQKTLINYANSVIGLFLGCFFLAGGMQKWGIDKRITLWLLSKGKIASSPQLTLLVMMYITAFISMWVSNTATTAIMLPIGVGILAQNTIDRSKNKFGTALMLGIAWSASVGAIGTIIGTPPNGIAISILRQSGLQTISFLDWMKFGVPYVIIFIPVVWFILLKFFPPGKDLRLNKEFLISEKRNLSKLSYGEVLVAVVFLTAVLLWVSNPFWKFIFPNTIFQMLGWIDEYAIGLFVGLILFLIPRTLRRWNLF